MKKETAYKIIDSEIIEVQSIPDTWHCVYATRHMAKEAGFSLKDEVLLATAVSELVVNIIKFTDGGKLVIQVILDDYNRHGFRIISEDHGPGIKDIELAVSEHYSTLMDSLGQGLPAVKRILDEFDITSVVGQGTTVTGIKWRHNEI